MNINGALKPPPHFFEFKLVHIIMLIPLAIMAVSWWTGHERASATASTQYVLTVQRIDTRLDGFDTRLTEFGKTQKTDSENLHELMTKFRIMVELVDGAKNKPELHK